MVRSNRRKPIEELYGSKFETLHPPKSQVAHTLTPASTTTTTKAATLRTERGVTIHGPNVNTGGDTERNHKSEGRGTHREYRTANNYLISTNCSLTANNMMRTMGSGAGNSGQQQHQLQLAPYATSARRKNPTARQVNSKTTYNRNESNKMVYNDGALNMLNKSSKESGHLQQRGCFNSNDSSFVASLSDKEPMGVSMSEQSKHDRHQHLHQKHQHRLHHQQHMQPQHMQHQHMQHQQLQQLQVQHIHQPEQHHHPLHAKPSPNETSVKDDDDDDDDPDQFFEIIRQTVQNAIGTTVSDIFNRNFRDLHTKIERFSTELKHTNDHINNLQEHVTNKIIHYGEENSRHFRYLCMKSEYDKMFYQHHTLMVNKSSATLPPHDGIPEPNDISVQIPNVALNSNESMHSARLNTKLRCSETHRGQTKTTKNYDMNVQVPNPCVCHSTNKTPTISEPHNTSSDQSVGKKSSDMGMREVLEHIQRFCTVMQCSDFGVDTQKQQQQQQQQKQQQQELQQQQQQQHLMLQIQQQQQQQQQQLQQQQKHRSYNSKNHLNINDIMNSKISLTPTTTTTVTSETVFNGLDEDFDYPLSSDGSSRISDESDTEKYDPVDGTTTARGARLHMPATGGGDCK